MPKRNTTPPPEDDILVKPASIKALAETPLANSTFYDWVNAGKVVRAKDLPGYYLLNATRVKLGLPPVDVTKQLECQADKRPSERSLAFLALSAIVPEAITVFPDEELPDALSIAEAERVKVMIDHHRPEIEKLEDKATRFSYVSGALQAASLDLGKSKS